MVAHSKPPASTWRTGSQRCSNCTPWPSGRLASRSSSRAGRASATLGDRTTNWRWIVVKGSLVTALDWRPKKGEPGGSYSYRTGEVWNVVQYGPGYSNTFLVTAYDDAGLQWL